MAAQRRETLKAQAQRESLVDVVPNLASLCLVMLRLWLQETFLLSESWMLLAVRCCSSHLNVPLLVLLTSYTCY